MIFSGAYREAETNKRGFKFAKPSPIEGLSDAMVQQLRMQNAVAYLLT